MDRVVRQIFLFIISAFGVVVFCVVLEALFPRRVGRARAVAEAMPGRAFAVGLVNSLFFGGIGVALLALADRSGSDTVRTIVSLPALAFLLVLGVGVSLGVAAMAVLAGDRLKAGRGAALLEVEGPAWKRTAVGALALGLACLTPFAGWFVLLPYVTLVGLGAFVLGLATSRAQPDKPL